MDLHGGYLFVNSEGEGYGSTFTMLIPVVVSHTNINQARNNIDEEESHGYDEVDHIYPESAKTQDILQDTIGNNYAIFLQLYITIYF